MTGTSLIEIRPDVMLGKPCLAGTRIPVSSEEPRLRGFGINELRGFPQWHQFVAPPGGLFV